MAEYVIEWLGIGDDLTAQTVSKIRSERLMEPIVRCADCMHYHPGINGCDEFGDIWHDEYANVEPRGFCAWGKRKVADLRFAHEGRSEDAG